MENSDVRCCVCSKGANDADQNGKKRTFVQIGSRNVCYECSYDANLQFELQAYEDYSKKGSTFNIRRFTEYLDKYVAGQQGAKKALAMQVYYQSNRTRNPKGNYPRSSLMFLGPTGSGKTLLAETAARYLGTIVRKFDITQFTSAGYAGRDIEEIMRGVFEAAGRNVQKAENAIVILDEIDKIARSKNDTGKDVNGEAVQQALLTMLDGNDIPFKINQSNYMTLNTSKMLFICSGAFSELSTIIKNRTSNSSMGFGAEIKSKNNDFNSDLLMDVTTKDLVDYGMMPEFVGRMARYVVLERLSKNMLVTIMKETNNSVIRKYNAAYNNEGVKLTFKEDSLLAVAEKAFEMGTGARALNTILTEVLDDILYDILLNRKFIQECIITEGVIRRGESPKYLFRQRIETHSMSRANG